MKIEITEHAGSQDKKVLTGKDIKKLNGVFIPDDEPNVRIICMNGAYEIGTDELEQADPAWFDDDMTFRRDDKLLIITFYPDET